MSAAPPNPRAPAARTLSGRHFWKMSGSGNDFVFFDNRDARHNDLVDVNRIAALCDRRTGVGADGIVLIDASAEYAFGMRYYNRDGTLAEMCGNAALCATRLARVLGILHPEGDTRFDTPSGPVVARFADDEPEIDMVRVTETAPTTAFPREASELRIGFARVGVPHLVIHCESVDDIDVVRRGRQLRHDASLRDGANVNFVSHGPGGWQMRTYERGVEDETLACGTGSVATATLLHAWGLAPNGVSLGTRSGRAVYARGPSATTAPILRGEGRIVFEGDLIELNIV